MRRLRRRILARPPFGCKRRGVDRHQVTGRPRIERDVCGNDGIERLRIGRKGRTCIHGDAPDGRVVSRGIRGNPRALAIGADARDPARQARGVGAGRDESEKGIALRVDGDGGVDDDHVVVERFAALGVSAIEHHALGHPVAASTLSR